MADRAGIEPTDLRQVVAEHLMRVTGEMSQDVEANVDAVLDQLGAITQRFADGAALARVGDHVTEVTSLD